MDNNVSCYLHEIEILLITFLSWENSAKFKEEYDNFFGTKDFEGKNLFLFYFMVLAIESFDKFGIDAVNFVYDKKNFNGEVGSRMKYLRLTEFNNQTLLSFL